MSMDDAEWFVQRCSVLEHIAKNPVPENYSEKEKCAVFATILKELITQDEMQEKLTACFLDFLKKD